MTAANDPTAESPPPTAPPGDATAIQAGPPAEAPDIPLPPPPTPPVRKRVTPEQLAAEIARLDRVLVLMLLVLTFFLASFAVRNHDFWMHLATGRLIAQWQYTPGSDPFSYTSAKYWANHAWLYDLLLYGLTTLAGGIDAPAAGVVLVGFKALLIVALAVVLVCSGRPGRSLWAPALCAALAIVGISPRLWLQPICFSFLLLGLTVYVLLLPARRRARDPQARRTQRAYWLLVPLFILWVNLDSWFLLGPLAAGLYSLGQYLQETFAPLRTAEDAPEPGELRTLLLALVAGVAACLVNPHHYHAFLLPQELYSPVLDAIHARDARLFMIPSLFDPQYYRLPFDGGIVATWFLLPLAVLSLLSFAPNLKHPRLGRAVLWLGFLGLALYQARALLFFAIVAAPVTALNLQDFAVREFGPRPLVDARWRQWSLGGRLLTLLALAGLTVVSWPGWLYSRSEDPRRQRRVAWALEPDPSVRQAAEQLGRWREQGLLGPETHGFQFSPEIPSYCAWFCPGEKSFFDLRLPLFDAAVAGSYVEVRHGLRGVTGREASELGGGSAAVGDGAWEKVFRDPRHQIRYVVLNTMGEDDALRSWVRMVTNPEAWSLLYTDGRISILGWLTPPAPAFFRTARYDPRELAFGPQPVKAPEQGPGRSAQRPDLWQQFLHAPAPHPVAADGASLLWTYFSIASEHWPTARWPTATVAALWFADWTSAVGRAAAVPGTVLAPFEFATVRFNLQWQFLGGQGGGPPAPLLLAVRAARQALDENPDDFGAWFSLAQTYRHLWMDLEARWSSRQYQRPLMLRQVQLATALQNALTLRPDSVEAHRMLWDYYLRVNYLDLGLDQLNEEYRLLREGGRGRDETVQQFQQLLDGKQKYIKELDTTVSRARNEYAIAAANQPAGAKAALALQRGLAKEALTILMQVDPAQFGDQELNLELLLLLTTGQTEIVREGLQPQMRAKLGASYEWYQTMLAAATGNYRDAGQYVDDLTAVARKEASHSVLVLTDRLTLRGDMDPTTMFYGLNGIATSVRNVASFYSLRGLIAVEQGDNATALKSFRQALDYGRQPGETGLGALDFDGKGIAVRYGFLLEQFSREPRASAP
jgi:hypothetical protein